MTFTASDIQELRYDGPIPAWERPQADANKVIRQRMRTHRRMAGEYVKNIRQHRQRAVDAESIEAGAYHAARLERAVANLRDARRAHFNLAACLGE